MFLLFIIYHWVADFVFQSDWMAKNKSKNWFALFIHVAIYSAVMTLTFIFTLHPYWNQIFWFVGITFTSHFITDAITSRINTYLWNKGDTHNFFVCIGLDQVLHYFALYVTFVFLGFQL